MEDHAYMPPMDCEECADDVAVEGRLCTFVCDVPTFRDEAGALLMCACDATFARRRALRALGGTWRMVRIREGVSSVGWLFSSADAERALDALHAPP